MSEVQKTSPKARQSQVERRERSDRAMFKAAVELIARNGLPAMTLAEVGTIAGYSRGLVVERYGSKSGLVCALLDSMERWFNERLEVAIDGKHGLGRLRARIATHLHGVRVSAHRVGALYAIHAEAGHGMPEVERRVKQQEHHWRDGFRLDLESAIEQGEADPAIDANQCARVLFAAQRGLLLDFLAAPDAQFLDEAERALAALAQAAANGHLGMRVDAG